MHVTFHNWSGLSFVMVRAFFVSIRRLLPILLLALAAPAMAQRHDDVSTFYREPLAVQVGLLPDGPSGSSSLFFLDGTLWTCNDHGTLVLYALDTLTASVTATLDLGVKVYDLEEVTQDERFLYFGDIGDNAGSRPHLRVLRLAKSDFRRRRFRFDTIRFTYPDRSAANARDFDCEAFLATADSLYFFTKQWFSQGSACYSVPNSPGDHVAMRRFTLRTDGLVTGACYLPQLRTLALVGYSLLVQPFVYLIDGFDSCRFDLGRHRRTNLANPVGSQTEGIASLDGIHYFLTRETLTLAFFSRQAALLRLDLSGLPVESNER